MYGFTQITARPRAYGQWQQERRLGAAFRSVPPGSSPVPLPSIVGDIFGSVERHELKYSMDESVDEGRPSSGKQVDGRLEEKGELSRGTLMRPARGPVLPHWD